MKNVKSVINCQIVVCSLVCVYVGVGGQVESSRNGKINFIGEELSLQFHAIYCEINKNYGLFLIIRSSSWMRRPEIWQIINI